MANYREDFANINLETGTISRNFMNHSIGGGDALCDRFGVRVFRNGEAVTLGGTCAGYFVRNTTGETVVITGGVVSGNEAYVTLPAACYAVEGSFTLAIKVTVDSEIVTLRIVDGVVDRTNTSVIVDPGDILPSIEDLLQAIEDAVESIPADYSSLWTSLAPAFSSSTAYTAGQYVTYDGKFWRFTTDHAAGAWNAAHVTQVNVGGDMSDLKSALSYKVDKEYSGATADSYLFLTKGEGWVYTNGKITETNDRARSNQMLNTPDLKSIKCTSTYRLMVFGNNEGAENAMEMLSSWVTETSLLGIAYKYIFVSLKRSDGESLISDDLSSAVTLTKYTTAVQYAKESEIGELQERILCDYPQIEVGSINVNNGGNTDATNRARTDYIKWESGVKISCLLNYSYYLIYFNSSKTWTGNSGEWKLGDFTIPECGYYRLLIKSDAVSDFTGVTNNFIYTYIGNPIERRVDVLESNNGNKVFTIGQNDNVVEVISNAMQYRGSLVYIEPYEHNLIYEFEDFYGATYFSSMSSGRGFELGNDIHIIGQSGHILKCYYTGNNDYVMENFSLFNNKQGSPGYTIENVRIDTKKIRYPIHDERGTDAVPYKVRYLHCYITQDQTGSTWDSSCACIGGGLGQHGDIVVEDCIFDTVTTSENKDSIAYHNSSSANAQSTLIIKNCYCKGDSTLQLAAFGDSTKKTQVIVANCSFGSPVEIYDWSEKDNLEIYQINNVVRT